MDNIFIVDCFCTDQKGSGNPAAVVTDFSGEDSERLALAQKLGKPVTVFLSDATAHEPQLQFFYPNTQMPMCLHGTLAAAKIIFDNSSKQSISFLTSEGKKLIVNKSKENCLQVKVSSQPFIEPEIKKEIVCKMLNLSDSYCIADNLPFRISSVGSPKLLVPLTSLKLLSVLQPNYELIKQCSIENKINGLYVYTTETYSDSSDFHARGFNPKTGYNEDAATGVAAAALSLALKKDINIEQGHSINRPCSIVVTYINPDNILVGGAISTVKNYINIY